MNLLESCDQGLNGQRDDDDNQEPPQDATDPLWLGELALPLELLFQHGEAQFKCCNRDCEHGNALENRVKPFCQ